MPVNPIELNENAFNPFVLEQSKLLKAAMELARAKTAAVKFRAAAAPTPAPKPQFEISTNQIITLITRYKIDRMSHKQLDGLPFSQLTQQERDFINYLRRNPDIFRRIARLDKQPKSISTQDIKIAAQLAGNTLVLSEDDLKYLKEAPETEVVHETEDRPLNRLATRLKTDDLIRSIQKLTPEKGLTFEALMAMGPDDWRHLNETEREGLEFLRSATVSKVLEKVALPYNGMITPEALRVLTSLLWNPAIYGATPIVFHQTAPLEHLDIEPVSASHLTETINDENRHEAGDADHFCPSRRVEAHHIINICHKLSPDGHVSLKQLQHYKPENPEEEKALNLLRQAQIFRMLAGLDNDPTSLSDDDIKLALAEGTIMLSDPYIVLVVLP